MGQVGGLAAGGWSNGGCRCLRRQETDGLMSAWRRLIGLRALRRSEQMVGPDREVSLQMVIIAGRVCNLHCGH